MTKKVKEYIKLNLPYYGKIGSDTQRGKDTLRKKAWVITSQFVRMRDYIKYGYCVSCKKPCSVWQETDPAHFHSFAGSGAMSGFNLMNIHMSCKYCNGFRGAVAGHEMAQEIVMRYGKDIIKELNDCRNTSVKADDWFFIEVIENVYSLFKVLKESYPDFDYPEYL